MVQIASESIFSFLNGGEKPLANSIKGANLLLYALILQWTLV